MTRLLSWNASGHTGQTPYAIHGKHLRNFQQPKKRSNGNQELCNSLTIDQRTKDNIIKNASSICQSSLQLPWYVLGEVKTQKAAPGSLGKTLRNRSRSNRSYDGNCPICRRLPTPKLIEILGSKDTDSFIYIRTTRSDTSFYSKVCLEAQGCRGAPKQNQRRTGGESNLTGSRQAETHSRVTLEVPAPRASAPRVPAGFKRRQPISVTRRGPGHCCRMLRLICRAKSNLFGQPAPQLPPTVSLSTARAQCRPGGCCKGPKRAPEPK